MDPSVRATDASRRVRIKYEQIGWEGVPAGRSNRGRARLLPSPYMLGLCRSVALPGLAGRDASRRVRILSGKVSSRLGHAHLYVVHGFGRADRGPGLGVPALAGGTLTFSRRLDWLSGAWPAEAGTPNPEMAT